MEYQPFLEERRRRIAAVIRAGFETVLAEAPGRFPDGTLGAAEAEMAQGTDRSAADRLGELLGGEARGIVTELLEEPILPTHKLLGEVAGYLAKLEVEKDFEDRLDIETARDVADRCTRLLVQLDESSDDEARHLVQAAAVYFVLDDDAESDSTSPNGFDDDLAVVEAVETVLGAARIAA